MTEIATDELDRDIAAFEAMKAELEEHHNHKWVLFQGGKFVGAFDTIDNVANEAIRRFGKGPYLIRQVGASKTSLPASVMYRPVHAA